MSYIGRLFYKFYQSYFGNETEAVIITNTTTDSDASLEESSLPRTVTSTFVLVLIGYILLKTNFGLLRAFWGILTIIGGFALYCILIDIYQNLPFPLAYVCGKIKDYFVNFFKYAELLIGYVLPSSGAPAPVPATIPAPTTSTPPPAQMPRPTPAPHH